MLTLLTVLALGQLDDSTQVRVPHSADMRARRAGGRSGTSSPFFEFAPASGAGMGTACAGTTPTGTLGEVMTFTRASAAECISNDGQTLTQVSSGQPRVSSGAVGDTWLGIWVDPQATNLVLQSRDLSQVVWNKTTMTCALTATGMRGVANSASTCTATAANATVCQSITVAAATRSTSWHVKRRTGTGGVTFSRDNFTTTTADTSSRLSSVLWSRVVPSETPGCAGGRCIIEPLMVSGGANPIVCLKLATSGDAVDIDFVQDEDNDRATSPIETGAVAVTRLPEVVTLAHAGVGTWSMSALSQHSTNTRAQFDSVMQDFNSGSNRVAMFNMQGSGVLTGVQCAVQSVASTGGSFLYSPEGRRFPKWSAPFTPISCIYGSTTVTHDIRGRTSSTTGATPPIGASAPNVVHLGQPLGSGKQWGGVIKGVKLGSTPGSGVFTGPYGTPAVAWLGDSITEGEWAEAVGGGDRPPDALTKLISKAVFNFGVSGDLTTGCLNRWRSQISGRGFSTLVVLCGVNDAANDLSAASAFANLQTIYTEAKAQGLKVIPVLLTPWANSVAPPVWSAGRQTITDTINASIVTWATANNASLYVDTSSLGSGSPLQLLVANQAGGSDKVHLSVAGALALATLVQAANP